MGWYKIVLGKFLRCCMFLWFLYFSLVTVWETSRRNVKLQNKDDIPASFQGPLFTLERGKRYVRNSWFLLVEPYVNGHLRKLVPFVSRNWYWFSLRLKTNPLFGITGVMWELDQSIVCLFGASRNLVPGLFYWERGSSSPACLAVCKIIHNWSVQFCSHPARCLPTMVHIIWPLHLHLKKNMETSFILPKLKYQ